MNNRSLLASAIPAAAALCASAAFAQNNLASSEMNNGLGS
jgi:hypothetical protein